MRGRDDSGTGEEWIETIDEGEEFLLFGGVEWAGVIEREIEGEAEEAHIAWRNGGGDGLTESETECERGLAGIADRLIPAFFVIVALGVVLGPALPGEGLEGEPGGVFFLGEPDDLRAEVFFVAGEIDGKKDGVEGVTVEGSLSSLDGMGGEPEVTGTALFFGFDEELHGSTGSKGGVDILLDISDGVELVEVEVIGLQAVEGTLKLLLGSGAATLSRFVGKEAVLAIRREGGAEFFLGVAIAGCDVVVVDSLFKRLGDNAGGIDGIGILHDDATEADDGQLIGMRTEGPARQPGRIRSVGPLRSQNERGSGEGRGFDEVAAGRAHGKDYRRWCRRQGGLSFAACPPDGNGGTRAGKNQVKKKNFTAPPMPQTVKMPIQRLRL